MCSAIQRIGIWQHLRLTFSFAAADLGCSKASDATFCPSRPMLNVSGVCTQELYDRERRYKLQVAGREVGYSGRSLAPSLGCHRGKRKSPNLLTMPPDADDSRKIMCIPGKMINMSLARSMKCESLADTARAWVKPDLHASAQGARLRGWGSVGLILTKLRSVAMERAIKASDCGRADAATLKQACAPKED